MNLPEQMYADLQAQIPALKEALATGTTYATDLGQRIINYDIAINSVELAVWLLIFYGMYKGFKMHWAWYKKDEHDVYEPAMTFLAWTFAIFPVIFFLEANPLPQIIKAVFVPEWRLIEILSKLIN